MEHIEIKHVTLEQLPPMCGHREFFEKVCVSTQAKVFVVAKEGAVKDWACYIGWPVIETIMESERYRIGAESYCAQLDNPVGVLSNGDKLNEQEALMLFPNWEHLKYRP